MEGPTYLLLDRAGQPLGLSDSREEAIEMAYEVDPSGQIYLDAPTEQNYAEVEAGESLALAANAKRKLSVLSKIKKAPQDSLRGALSALGKRKLDFQRAMDMTLEEAHEKMRVFFPTKRYSKEGRMSRVDAYSTPRRMSRRILGQNYKTAKETPPHIIDTLYEATGFKEASVMGLSLLPSTQSYRNDNVERIMETAPAVYGVQELWDIRINVCARATPECESSCLVFSGHNLSDDYNTVKKYALISSLVREPEAFIRMLAENIHLHNCSSTCAGIAPLIRLNVFSDLPWELMVPEMFEHFSDVQFYDYTKVPNRKPPANYDLTFSYAGTEQNVAAMDFEVKSHGRRVAVVFAATRLRRLYRTQWIDELGDPRERVSGADVAGRMVKKYDAEREYLGEFEIPAAPAVTKKRVKMRAKLPETFVGLPVVDGDESDMRPYDPAPVIVGLTWKEPKSQNVTLEQANVFVVLVDLVADGDGGYNAIVSKTARFDDVDYSRYAPSKMGG